MPKPQYVNIGGVRHQLVVMRIESRDEQGRPLTTFIGIDPEQVFELDKDNPENNHFITAYMPCDVLTPKATR